MQLLSYAAYTVGVIGLVLSPLGLHFNPRSWVHRMFAAGILTISVWAIAMAVLYQEPPESNYEPVLRVVLVSSTLVNPLVAGFILAMSRSRWFRSVVLQTAMWGSCLTLVAIDLAGGSYIVGLHPTPWGNAFVISTGARYSAQLLVMGFHFVVVLYASIRAYRLSVSRTYRRNLFIIAVLAPFLQAGIVLANFMLPVLAGQPFPSTGVLFWGVVEIVLFVSILGTNMLENEAEIILRGVTYSRTRPVVVYNPEFQIVAMNGPAEELLAGYGLRELPMALKDVVRNSEVFGRVVAELSSAEQVSTSITLADGLSSITLLPEGVDPAYSDSGGRGDSGDSGDSPASSGDRRVDEIGERFSLSPREREVLELLLQGFSTGEIAARLYVSHSTAKTHIARIHEKVGTSSRPALLAKVLQPGT